MNRKNKYPGVYKYKKGRFIVHWYDARNIKRSKVLNLTEKQASNWVEKKKNLVHKRSIGLIHNWIFEILKEMCLLRISPKYCNFPESLQ